MSQNWKDIGRFSNSKTYRNVNLITIGENNIGKLRHFHNENRNNTRGSLFDISGVNEIIGIGTNKPFSKLSLGDISGSGTFNIDSPGQLSAIALHEKSDGKEFSGLVFNNNIDSFNSENKKNALQFIAIDNRDFSMNDVNSGRLYLSEENITTIGGIPRKGPEYNQKYPELTKGVDIGNDSNIKGEGQTKIVLDVRGSIRTDGYLNFYSKFIYPSRTNTSNIICPRFKFCYVLEDHFEIVDDLVAFGLYSRFDLLFGNHDLLFMGDFHFLEHHGVIDVHFGLDVVDFGNQGPVVFGRRLEELCDTLRFTVLVLEGAVALVNEHDRKVKANLADAHKVAEVEELEGQRQLGFVCKLSTRVLEALKAGVHDTDEKADEEEVDEDHLNNIL